MDAIFFDYKRLALKDLSKVRAIFWCKQTTLNQTTVNMQYTRDIGNLGDDQRRKLQPSFSQKWYFKKKKALTPNKAITNGKMCRNKSIVN